MSLYADPTASPENQALAPLFEALCAHPPKAESRRRDVTRIVEHLERNGTLTTWARGLRYAHKAFHVDEDDVHQVIAVAVMTRLSDITETDVRKVRACYLQHLYQHGKHAIGRYMESGEVTGLSEATGAYRRQILVSRARRSLADQGIMDPTNQEIIDENARLTAHYANPVKNGLVLSERDLAPFGVGTSNLDSGIAVDFNAPEAHHDEHRFELDEAVRAVTSQIKRQFPDQTGVMACSIAWMRLVYVGTRPTTRLIAEETGLTSGAVTEAMALFQTVLEAVRRPE